MERVWRDIEFVDIDGTYYNYVGTYEISNYGEIRKNNKLLKPKNDKGYLRIGLTDSKGFRKFFQIHRLVAFVFLPNPNVDNPQVNHIDENKSNNRIDNLEWVSAKDNCNHGTRNKRMGEKLTNGGNTPRPVVGINTETNEIIEFSSITQAEKFCKGVGRVLRGQQKTSGGFEWNYKNK